MLRDPARISAYEEALKAVVKPGMRVLDLGAGTGFFSMVAARLGAQVVALESNDAIFAAKEMVHALGFQDRVRCVHARSTDFEDEPFDIVVSDLRGRLPLFGAHVPTLVDAKARLLRPTGVLLPASDVIQVAPIELAERYALLGNTYELSGLRLDAARRMEFNSRQQLDPSVYGPETLLAAPQPAFELTYGQAPPEVYAKDLRVPFTRSGVAHGLALWFDATLLANAQPNYTSGLSPGLPLANVYGATWLPLERPLTVEPGQVLRLRVVVRAAADDYVLAWSGELEAVRGSRFAQSTFLSQPRLPRPHGEPSDLNDEGHVLARALVLLSSRASLAAIAQVLEREYPAFFARRAGALPWVEAATAPYRRPATE
jgi:SAM-dependent methyltransferase